MNPQFTEQISHLLVQFLLAGVGTLCFGVLFAIPGTPGSPAP